MKEKLTDSKNKIWARSAITIALLSIVVGIVGGGLTLTSAYRELDGEHHKHLESLVWSTDKNLADLFDYCRLELKKDCAEYDLKNAKSFVKEIVDNKDLDNKRYDAIVVMRDNRLLASTDAAINNLKFYRAYNYDEPCLCTDEHGIDYLAIIEHTDSGVADVATLQRLDKFFDKFVGNELTEDYWLALYDTRDGICLQDDAAQSYLRIIDYEEALKLNDSVTIMANSENSGKILAKEYEIDSDDNDFDKYLVTTLPTNLGKNGCFVVGIAAPTYYYETIMNKTFWRTGICGALILFGVLIIFLVFRKHRISNEAMLADIELLEEKNKSLQKIMNTSQEIAHQQRLVTIGTLASNIHHEFSNLLTPIISYSLLAMEKTKDEEMLDYLEKIYESSSKSKTLVARLLKLSRKVSEDERGECSPDMILDKVEDVLVPSLPKNVEIEKDYNCPEDCIMGNETQLGQVFINLVLNAFQAMSENGGTLQLSTYKVNDHVEMCIKDDGPGIPEEVLPHIFETFYTTKAGDKGTGLGLAIARQIVESHHGRIEVSSEPGKGTEFKVLLPLITDNKRVE